MSVIAEFSVPASDFVLGRALSEAAWLAIEIEQAIPTGGATVPYFWVVGDDEGAVEDVLERDPGLSGYEVVDELDDRRLYRATWDAAADTLLQVIASHDVVLLEAGGDADSWRFKFRFPDGQNLAAFRTSCREADVDLELTRLFNLVEPVIEEHRRLTETQRSTIELAYEAGYFEVPRRVTLTDLADELGISDQAVNERLRRGLNGLIESTLRSMPQQ